MNTSKVSASILAKFARAAAVAAAAHLVGSAASAAPNPAEPVFRVQIEVAVANVSDAGTKNGLFVRFGSGSRFVLNYGHRDFQRGSRFTYDVSPGNVSTIADITSLTIAKTGDDGIALSSVKLIVNGVPLFATNFGGRPYWLDSEDAHRLKTTFTGAAMQASPEWKAYKRPYPPRVLLAAELESRIEGIVGNATWGTKVGWGHRHGRASVEVSRSKKDPRRIDVDLDLEGKVWGPNPEVDVDFSLQFVCKKGTLKVVVSSLRADVDYGWFGKLLSLGSLQLIENYIQKAVDARLASMFPSGTLASGLPFCPSIEVKPDGSIVFGEPK